MKHNRQIPQLGMWHSMCCWEDLYEIKTEKDLQELNRFIADCYENGEDPFNDLKIFTSKNEALMYFSEGESEENLQRIKELHGWERPVTS